MSLKPRKIRGYGWNKDIPDARDHRLVSANRGAVHKAVASQPILDLRPQMPPVYDQGDVGSCTANAIAGAIQFERSKQKLKPDFTPSRLFIYYNERVIEGTVNEDSGAMIRDGIKSVSKLGAPPEKDWVYRPDVQLFTRPSVKAYNDALPHTVSSYLAVNQTIIELLACLSDGYPFVFGFSVFDSFESDEVAQTGIVPMPDLQNEQLLGGHAVLAVGYDTDNEVFICRNSWGPNWGQAGYFTLPFAYVKNANLASDFWTIRLETA